MLTKPKYSTVNNNNVQKVNKLKGKNSTNLETNDPK